MFLMNVWPLCAYWSFWMDRQSTHQNEYVFCLPPHSLLLPIFHLFRCLPYSSLITELPEYQIITNSSANINKFLCLQWNYANFHWNVVHLFITWFILQPYFIFQTISQLYFFLLWRRTLLRWEHHFPVLLLHWLQGNSEDHDHVML